jgi:hypothetical protein
MTEIDERTGLLNAVTLLPTRVPDIAPTVTLSKAGSGSYLVEFDYSPRVVTLLKSAVPASMRRWRDAGKRWEVNVDWAGPLVGALRNAGFGVTGLGQFEEAELFWWCLSPVPIGKDGQRAYVKGFCATCEQQPHRRGVECNQCYRKRVLRQHRVRTALAAAGLAPYPQARPSAGSALRCRIPVCAQEDEAPEAAPDHTAALDAVIVAARDHSPNPPCPVCGRRPANGAVVHIGCRRRLLALLADRPFTRPRNKAFQIGLCTICLARPHRPPGRISCEHCHGLVREVDRYVKGDDGTASRPP